MVWGKQVSAVPTAAIQLIVRLKGMPWPQTGATHYPAQLRLQDKGRAIKEWLSAMYFG